MTDLKAPPLDVKKSSKKEKGEKVQRTIRIELKLFEPSSDNFPQFNVPKLLYKEAKKHRQASSVPVVDENATQSVSQFSDNDEDEVARIAKQFEEKYGAGSGYDMNDKAAGYDDNDSFIDNTEAYDEMFVDDTPRGGFYINSGPLVFKKDNKEKMNVNVVATKKRSVGSLSSVETDENEENGATSSGTSNKKTKVHKAKTKKVKRKEEEEPEKKGKEIAIKDMLRAKRDSLLKTKQDSPKHHKYKIMSDDEESVEPMVVSESSNDSDVKLVETTNMPSVQLPSGLPESIMKHIQEFESLTFGKTQEEVTSSDLLYQILLEIETSTLGIEVKSQIKSYLLNSSQCKGLYKKIAKERRTPKPEEAPIESSSQSSGPMDCLPSLD